MSVLESQIQTSSEGFRANSTAMEEGLNTLARHLRRSRQGGGEKYIRRHLSRGRLLPRDRIEYMLDRDSHFLEICPLAGMDIEGCRPGAGLIAGIGRVEGVECVLTANESTVQGGAINSWAVRKTRRVAEIALENRLPVVSMVESAGADLMNQADIFVPGGQGFRDLTERSKARIPTKAHRPG